jgi:hypothetical protein
MDCVGGVFAQPERALCQALLKLREQGETAKEVRIHFHIVIEFVMVFRMSSNMLLQSGYVALLFCQLAAHNYLRAILLFPNSS